MSYWIVLRYMFLFINLVALVMHLISGQQTSMHNPGKIQMSRSLSLFRRRAYTNQHIGLRTHPDQNTPHDTRKMTTLFVQTKKNGFYKMDTRFTSLSGRKDRDWNQNNQNFKNRLKENSKTLNCTLTHDPMRKIGGRKTNVDKRELKHSKDFAHDDMKVVLMNSESVRHAEKEVGLKHSNRSLKNVKPKRLVHLVTNPGIRKGLREHHEIVNDSEAKKGDSHNFEYRNPIVKEIRNRQYKGMRHELKKIKNRNYKELNMGGSLNNNRRMTKPEEKTNTLDLRSTPYKWLNDDEEEVTHDQSSNQETILDHATQHTSFLCAGLHNCRCYIDSQLRKHADCSNAYSIRISTIPQSLPTDIWSLNMSSNVMTIFNIKDIIRYPILKELDLSNNQISSLLFDHDGVFKLTLVNISSNKLWNLENVSFKLFPELQRLSLHNNKINVIHASLFNGCTKLIHLDLSRNEIKSIHVEAFDSLHSLVELFLNRNNELGYNFKPGLFHALQNLRKLHLQCSSHGALVYPNKILGNLVNLRELYIDGLAKGAEFGPKLRKLTHLRTISFNDGCKCHMQNISSTFFDNVPFIKSLTFHSCPFHFINPRAFRSIPHLEYYTYTDPPQIYDLSQAFHDLIGLQMTSLKSVTLSKFRMGVLPCKILTFEEGQYIQNLTLEELDLSNNNLAILGDNFIAAIPRTIKRLILRDNRFTLRGSLWGRLANLPFLSELDLQDQDDPDHHLELMHSFLSVTERGHNHFNSEFQDANSNTYNCRDKYSINEKNKGFDEDEKYSHTLEKIHSSKNIVHGHITANNYWPIISRKQILLPPDLKIVRASRYLFFGHILLFKNVISKQLSRIEFSQSFMTQWGKGRLPSSIEHADLSFNFCNILKPRFFPYNNSLRVLLVKNNYLGQSLVHKSTGYIFANANKLVHLDMEQNSIFYLPRKVFQGLNNLKRLLLVANKLQIIDMDFSYTPELRFIDLSKNSITWISQSSRHDFDTIASRHPLEINLSYNPLPCTCNGIELLQWMLMTKVTFKSLNLLTCSTGGSNEVAIGDIQKRINELNRQCSLTKYVITVGVFIVLNLVLFIGGALMYKHRWKIIYARNLWLVNMYGFRPMGKTVTGCIYDAYVVYCEDDRDFALGTILEELEQKRSHRVCVEDRDFLPGSFNFNNITCAIKNSTVTLLILSPDFLKDKELEYPTQMALIEEYSGQTKRDIVLLLSYKRPNSSKMSKELLMLMKLGRFFEYPLLGSGEEGEESEEDVAESTMQAFWDTLSRQIGHAKSASNSSSLDLT